MHIRRIIIYNANDLITCNYVVSILVIRLDFLYIVIIETNQI